MCGWDLIYVACVLLLEQLINILLAEYRVQRSCVHRVCMYVCTHNICIHYTTIFVYVCTVRTCTYMYILFNHISSKRVIVVKLRIQVTYLPNGPLHVYIIMQLLHIIMLYVMYSVRSFACSVVEWNPLIRTP